MVEKIDFEKNEKQFFDAVCLLIQNKSVYLPNIYSSIFVDTMHMDTCHPTIRSIYGT